MIDKLNNVDVVWCHFLTHFLPNVNRNSIRVIHNSRRWWYQPQALVRERSGLTDSPCIWFLKGILRSHGYDQKTLQLLVGSQVTATSWQIGDLVVPKRTPRDGHTKEMHCTDQNEAVGRIVFENLTSTSVSSVRARVSGSVLVEFVSKRFADGVSVQTGTSFKEKQFSLDKRRVQISRLVHTSASHGVNITQLGSMSPFWRNSNSVFGSADVDAGTKPMDVEETGKSGAGFVIDDNVRTDLKRMITLDPAAIERTIHECNKTSMSLTGLFNAGLPKAALEALDHVLRNLEESKSDGNLAQAITGLGKLGLIVAEKTFPDECEGKIETKSGRVCAVESEVLQSQAPMLHTAGNFGLQARARPSDADRGGALQESSRASRLVSLQQRHRMLLTLMTRARRSESGSIADLLSREMHGIPSLHMNADTAAALLFSATEDFNNLRDVSENPDSSHGLQGHENARPMVSAPSIACSNSSSMGLQETLLDTLCRGRAPVLTLGAGAECPVHFSSIRNIIDMGILGNSIPWLKSLLDSIMKKLPTKQASGLPILKSAADEDGTPLLQLAISLGCSHLVVEELIAYGAPVGESEIQIAADNDLPEVLSVLLNYKLYSEEMLDLNACSSAVSSVVREAVSRQQAQLHALRKEADIFLGSFFQKILEICLSHRQRRQFGESDICGRAIAGALVGNVELCALQLRRTRVNDETGGTTSNQELQILEGRDSAIHASGFMQVLPKRILGRSLAERSSHRTMLLLLIEDFLCSKGINDGGCGLALLVTLLRRFPPIVESPEMERYGFAELVASHDALALNRLEELSSRVAKKSSATDDEQDIVLGRCLVLCPKKHAASVHVTKHASFRCDVCGKGVERGAVMHGCRECDWDACEFCTDKAEGGIVKWKYVRELASACQELLSQDTQTMKDNFTQSDFEWSAMVTPYAEPSSDGMDANTLSIRLLQRDPDSLKVLASKLNHRGQLTMHQFLCVILPALHSALMGKSRGNKLDVRWSGAGRRSKKPRVTGFSAHAIEERMHVNEIDRLDFAKEIIKAFVDDRCSGIEATGSHHNRDGARSQNPDADDDDNYEGSDDGYDDQDAYLETKDVNSKVAQLPELFRRLHQVLSLHEDVGKLAALNIGKTGAGLSSELNALTKPVRIALIPGHSAQNKQHKLHTVVVTLEVEPLVSVEDISRQVLKTAATTNAQYVSFCRKLAEDSSVIVEKASTLASGQHPWRIAKICSYDEKGGWHTVRYARSLGEFENLDKVLLHGDREIDRLEYDQQDTKLLLVARTFVVIHRGKHAKHLKSPFNMEQLLAEGIVSESDEKISSDTESCVVGQRVESDFRSPGWLPYTIVSAECCDQEKHYALVADDGEVFSGVPLNRIRGIGNVEETPGTSGPGSRSDHIVAIGRNGDPRAQLSRAFPFLTSRRQESREDFQGGLENRTNKRMLKRTWSALGPLESMSPAGIKAVSRDSVMSGSNVTSWICDIGGRKYEIFIPQSLLERPPSLLVQYKSVNVSSPVKVPAPDDTTLLSLLYSLFREEFEVFGSKPHQIIYSIAYCPSKHSKLTEQLWEDGTLVASLDRQTNAYAIDSSFASRDEAFVGDEWPTENRSRKLVPPVTDSDDENANTRLSVEGFDEICVQCVEILELLAEVKTKMSGWTKEGDNSLSVFVNEELSQKLSSQLENPLCVVGGVAPEWCFSVPSYAPHV